MRVSAVFADRAEAGQRVAAELEGWRGSGVVVVAMPRGGVPVGFEVARQLGAVLDVVIVKKLSAPGPSELSIGAAVGVVRPEIVLDEEVVRALGVSASWIRAETARRLEEIRADVARFRSGTPAVDIRGRPVLLVDDGIATGSSVRAAIRGLRQEWPRSISVAVPVAPTATLAALRPEVEELTCLEAATDFQTVGQYYEDFEPVSAAEVRHLLAENRGR